MNKIILGKLLNWNQTSSLVNFVRVNIVSGLLLFNANSAIFQLSYGEIKLIFNEMMMKSALYILNLIYIVLAH